MRRESDSLGYLPPGLREGLERRLGSWHGQGMQGLSARLGGWIAGQGNDLLKQIVFGYIIWMGKKNFHGDRINLF